MKYAKYYDGICIDEEIEIPLSTKAQRWKRKNELTYCSEHDTYFNEHGDENTPPEPCWQCWNEFNKAK